MSFMIFAAAVWLLVAHLALWVYLFNRLHAAPLSCRAIKILEKPIMLAAVLLPPIAVWDLGLSADSRSLAAEHPVWTAYFLLCTAMGIKVALSWSWHRIQDRQPAQLVLNHTETIDLLECLGRPPIGSLLTRVLAWIPGNEIFRLSLHNKTLVVSQLPSELDGLTIAHLSDFHYAGHLTKEYFECLVDRTNALQPDLIAVTGDIVDKAEYLAWIPETLGKLRAPYGVYFVLGNHDKRIPDVPALRRVLTDSGLVDLGGRAQTLVIRGQQVLLAGNELPWFGPAPDLSRVSSEIQCRILLAHTPDQFGWARRNGFGLMLAGHTHGGQIRLPLIGPVVSPSKHGGRYASGVFYQPPTLMHVSRGVSGMQPIRLNCPPELALLRIRKHGGED